MKTFLALLFTVALFASSSIKAGGNYDAITGINSGTTITLNCKVMECTEFQFELPTSFTVHLNDWDVTIQPIQTKHLTGDVGQKYFEVSSGYITIKYEGRFLRMEPSGEIVDNIYVQNGRVLVSEVLGKRITKNTNQIFFSQGFLKYIQEILG